MSYIRFHDEQNEGKTKIISVIAVNSATGLAIGQIKWINNWREYAYRPHASTLLNSACLRKISDKIEELMEERKTERGNKY